MGRPGLLKRHGWRLYLANLFGGVVGSWLIFLAKHLYYACARHLTVIWK